jgi:hypothetical protein
LLMHIHLPSMAQLHLSKTSSELSWLGARWGEARICKALLYIVKHRSCTFTI